MKAIKKNLKDQILTDDKKIMFCNICGTEGSANSGDYWNTPEEYRFKCCNRTMSLVNKKVRVIYSEVKG